jgi:site-specific recombinase XerD
MTTLRENMKREMTLRGFADGTQKQYMRAVLKLHDHYKQSPAKLSDAQIKAFLLFILESKKYAPSTYNILIHGLKFFYENVLNKKMVEIILPRVKEPQKLPEILSQREVTRIIQSSSNLKHRAILIVTYGAGLRAAEVASLRVNDLDKERSLIHIRQGKGNKDRYVLLSPMMLETLRAYWKTCRSPQIKEAVSQGKLMQENVFLFPNRFGKALSSSSVGSIYTQAKQKAEIKKKGGVHALRHAFATHALESGADLYTIQQLLGHSSLNSTVRYLRMTEKTIQKIQSPVECLSL